MATCVLPCRMQHVAVPPCVLTRKHGQLVKVGDAAEAPPLKAAPQVTHKDLRTLVEEQLAAPAHTAAGAHASVKLVLAPD